MAFIETISPALADGAVREMYDRQQRKYGYVPNYARTFSHRPEIMKLWADLLRGVRRNMDDRRFELVTVAAAMAVRSTYCSLAHGQALTRYFTSREVLEIISDSESSPLSAAEKSMVAFASKVARDAASVTPGEIAELKAAGFSDCEIFDIAAAATSRTFFAQLCEGLGTIGDHSYPKLEAKLRAALAVGRPLEFEEPERLREM